ncbi:hypothetical protein R4227_16385 [Gordonia amicalis]|uniref:hypothetical protein n=1 Tax=Gordonia amicalis TaxID=89053 RepID=UPI002955DF39|nr:hypothetical protein [Gordonia amicalis]MDV7101650.1 hypothetical protein [Gordonia amicalis]
MTSTVNRYQRLDAYSDLGLGADEVGTRRFTRPCERVDPDAEASRVAVDSSRVEVGDPSGMDLDSMFAAIDDGQRADLESEIAEGWREWETMPAGTDRDALRDHIWAMEDRADAITTEDSRADRPGQENGPGGAPTPSGATVSNPHQESENY